jgi:thiol-disulfide isomerase/thioredoxin
MTEQSSTPHAATAERSRRQILFGSVAGAAVLTGVGLAWWMQPRKPAAELLPEDMWNLKLRSPAGGDVALASFRGKPLVLNFWATWCPPCVEEMPLLDRFYRENSAKSWNVLGLAVDRPDPVVRFLRERPVAFPIALAQDEGMGLAARLGDLTSGLPFSVVLAKNGAVVQRKMGRLSERDIAAWQGLTDAEG